MKTDLAMKELAVSLRALRAVVAEFPALPAPAVHLSPIFPERLELSLHDDLGAFEPWRLAFDIAPEDVRFGTQSDGQTWVLKAHADFAGASVHLIAFGAALNAEGGGDA
ncbi:hypothetical protein [Streptomyces aureoverticillatus]|uniref:hypothetical protein n=1 Tax=Streptomyces aureoverticillatus TaxID=66871 RepID=UPI0013DAA038|nr:hypothetical protein [Streptomyces aureoverticillatus]QIB44875.1 hypothetical protein G3H79_19120 [Streptomyces aureoverticillatus]